jgi:type II secretory pathway pseudopilin PulG
MAFTAKSMRRAFTVLELLIGMVVMVIVLAALSAISLSVVQGWEQADGTQTLELQSEQIYTRVRHYLSSAKYIGLVDAGSLTGTVSPPATIFFWANDDWLGVSDGAPEIGEMAEIAHDPTTNTLWLYQPIPAASMNATQLAAAGTVLTDAEITSSTWATNFQTLSYVTKTAIGTDVLGCVFDAQYLISTTQRPVVEVDLVLSRPPQADSTQYGSVVLRAPTTQPQ